MGFRVVMVSKSAKLDLKLNYLVIRDREVVKVHISEIMVLILENTAISMTAALLCELVKQKVKVIFCDEKRNPISELLPYYGSHDCSQKLHMQIDWAMETKGTAWQRIVQLKIDKQKELLETFSLLESAEKLSQYSLEVKPLDLTNREGHAAKVYFNALFGMDFCRDHNNCINAALNYGYSILLSIFNREIVSSGYITQLGIFHSNVYNQFNLACDLMEPFRPMVDYVVKNIAIEQSKSSEKTVNLTSKEKRQLVDIVNREVSIDGKRQFLLNAIRIYVKGVLNYLNTPNASDIKAYKYEF